MKTAFMSLIIATLLLTTVRSRSCPTWFHKTAGSDECECGIEKKNVLNCYQLLNKTTITAGNCLTYDSDNNIEHFGQCPYAGKNSSIGHICTVPSDVSQLNEMMCGPLNRTGVLCSHCQPGLGPAVFSYYRECKECLVYPYGWILFFVRFIIPSTVFCVLVIALRINVASPALNGFVLAAQIITTVFSNNPISLANGSYNVVVDFVAGIYGIFSLDFFNFLIPSFCIGPDVSMLTVLALEYIIALYPIFFTVTVYLCITMHNKGFKIFVICWKPFHKCFARCRRSWELKGSVVNAFATFILLSYCKFSSISLYLLQKVPVLDKYGNQTYRLYYNASIYGVSSNNYYAVYFGISIFVLITMVFIPTVFILFYQIRIFQRCLFCCRIRCTLLHEMANIVQGCFKNGTTPGTRDYRWFAGLYLLLRIVLVSSINELHYSLYYQFLACIMSTVVAIMRPYRIDKYNTLDSFLWLCFGLTMGIYVYIRAYDNVSRVVLYISIGVPCAYFVCYVSWKFIVSFIKCCRFYIFTNVSKSRISIDENSVPDRLINPDEYTPLIAPILATK